MFNSPEIQSLIDRQIVTISTHDNIMVHNIFFVAKQNGDQRLIINLKRLNKYLRPIKFRMLTMSQFSRTLSQGDWFTKCDIEDAYYHVQILPPFQHYFAFYYNNKTYCFTRLPFGLSSGPFLFTSLLRPVIAAFRNQGIGIHAYLDDFIILSPNQTRALQDIHKVVSGLQVLGFRINFKKSELIPRNHIVFLGLLWGSVPPSVTLPTEKWLKLRLRITNFISAQPQTCKKLAQSLRLINFISLHGLPSLRRRVRDIQLALIDARR